MKHLFRFLQKNKKIVWILAILLIISSYKYYRAFAFQPDLSVVGFISEGDGLGRQSAELIDAFREEFSINFIPTRKEKKMVIPKRFQSFLCKKKPNWGKVIVFEDMLWRPGKNYFKKIKEVDPDQSICIAYSLWESTRIPQEWVQILNRYFDAVVVPSSFLIDTYKESGVEIPIFELPLGLDLRKFLTQPLKKSCGTPFVFGNLSACSERKNQVLLIRAFAKAFGNHPNVLLRINSRYGEKEVSDAIIQEIARHNLNNVIFTQKALSSDEYLELFKSIDCYVSPSKGEGFSIQPREAMALGIPVIVTDNTGQKVLCQSGLVEVVDSEIEEKAIFPWGGSYGHYYNCEENELVEAMKKVKNNYYSYLEKSSFSREWIKRYQYENLQSEYRSLIYPKEVTLGDMNKVTKSGLITSDRELREKYIRIRNLKKRKISSKFMNLS